MASICSSLRASGRPSVHLSTSKRSSAFHGSCCAPSRRVAPPARLIIVKTTEPSEPPTAEINKKEDFNVPHTGRVAPMSEDKRAATPEQMAAPEGDRAIAGQAWQPTDDTSPNNTAEARYGSEEAAAEAMEASKDRSRKSELQTGDDTAQTPGGGNTGEGSSA